MACPMHGIAAQPGVLGIIYLFYCPGFTGTNTRFCDESDNVANMRFLSLVWTQTLLRHTRFKSDFTLISEPKIGRSSPGSIVAVQCGAIVALRLLLCNCCFVIVALPLLRCICCFGFVAVHLLRSIRCGAFVAVQCAAPHAVVLEPESLYIFVALE